MAAVGWVAKWQEAAHMEVGMVQDEQAQWQSVARMAIAALLKAKIV